MDPSLLKDLKDFKKRSASQPTVEAKRAKTTPSKPKPAPCLPKELLQPKKTTSSPLDYKAPKFRSKHRFAVMEAIVNFMKERHLKRNFEELSLADILDYINYTDISSSDKVWLGQEALKNNPKLACKDEKYSFNPKYKIKDRKQLIKLLEKHEERGYGGVFLEDIRESLPDADNVLRLIQSRVIFITRTDKKVVLFNKNKAAEIKIDEDFQKHWRAISVDGIGEADIDKYLNNAGIAAMQDSGLSKQQQAPRAQRKKVRRKKATKIHNVHLDNSTLKDYTQDDKN